jgi:hypothetical protein
VLGVVVGIAEKHPGAARGSRHRRCARGRAYFRGGLRLCRPWFRLVRFDAGRPDIASAHAPRTGTGVASAKFTACERLRSYSRAEIEKARQNLINSSEKWRA